MYVTIVYVRVKPDCIDPFIQACKDNHDASITEPGNRRFDVLQEQDQPDRFVLYEAYDSQEHAAQHKQTEHYQTWRTTVENWMAEPRQGVVHQGLYPA